MDSTATTIPAVPILLISSTTGETDIAKEIEREATREIATNTVMEKSRSAGRETAFALVLATTVCIVLFPKSSFCLLSNEALQ
ncbi:hypothetical protein [Halalkalibaculum sp. DA3122]|uniref:hypothetical protein n=1 Tax=unclassified Halalkalibaculum TaxID=2964617 RepID=UPI003754177F